MNKKREKPIMTSTYNMNKKFKKEQDKERGLPLSDKLLYYSIQTIITVRIIGSIIAIGILVWVAFE